MKNSGLYITLILTFVSSFVFSAPPPPPAGLPGCWPPPCVPIDGGIVLLMAAGAAYGVKKIYDNRKKENTVN